MREFFVEIIVNGIEFQVEAESKKEAEDFVFEQIKEAEERWRSLERVRSYEMDVECTEVWER